MRKKLMYILTGLAAMFAAVPVYAQTAAAPAAGGGTNWVPIAAGFSMAIASGLCALGQGRATAAAAEALARNPGARPAVNFALIFGIVMIESLALYVFAIIFLKVK